MKNEYDSEYSNVKFIAEENIVLLTWKKFCSFDDYRNPAMFAAELLMNHAGSNYVIDARNGFEDDKADVKWGFEVLLPYMSKSDCRKCVFIMEEVPSIEEEMDMWTKEFTKYFEVYKVNSCDEAIKIIHDNRI